PRSRARRPGFGQGDGARWGSRGRCACWRTAGVNPAARSMDRCRLADWIGLAYHRLLPEIAYPGKANALSECVLRPGPSVQAYKAVGLIGERRAREPGSLVSRIHIDDRSSPNSRKLCRVRIGRAAADHWLAFLWRGNEEAAVRSAIRRV